MPRLQSRIQTVLVVEHRELSKAVWVEIQHLRRWLRAWVCQLIFAPVAYAKVFATVIPIRSPVNDPGPVLTQIKSS